MSSAVGCSPGTYGDSLWTTELQKRLMVYNPTAVKIIIIVRIVPLASERLALQGELQTGLSECDEASSQNQYSVDYTTFIGMLHNRSHFCAPQV